MNDLISKRTVIRMFNTADRYVADSLKLCNTDKTFPQNEVFIVDDIYEGFEHLSPAQPKRTGRWIETEGLDEEIRCTMCTNPMRSDRGCDGSCQYDEKLYKQIMLIIKDRIDGGGT